MKYGVQAASAVAIPSTNIRLIFAKMKQREQSRAKQQRSKQNDAEECTVHNPYYSSQRASIHYWNQITVFVIFP